jgi:hypothetical protein
MRLLTGSGLGRRCTRPGERTIYYCIEDDTWEKVVRRRIASMASFLDIARAGIELVGTDGTQATRVRAAYETFERASEFLANAPGPKRKK